MTSPIRAIVPGEEDCGVQKLCPHCGEWWPVDGEFYKPRSDGSGPQSWCRACCLEARYLRHPARRRVA